MKKQSVIGFFAVTLAGVLLHFLYEWSGKNKIIGYFSAVNESTFEHLKLLVFPVLAYSVIEYILFINSENFIFARTVGLSLSLLFIIVAFYTISGVVGTYDMPVINIGIFVVAVALTFIITSLVIKNYGGEVALLNTVSLVIIAAILVCVFVFTYNPPSIGLFSDPTA